jgi:hypothetical protein
VGGFFLIVVIVVDIVIDIKIAIVGDSVVEYLPGSEW